MQSEKAKSSHFDRGLKNQIFPTLTSYIHMALVLIIWRDCPLSDLVTLGTLEPSDGQHVHVYV